MIRLTLWPRAVLAMAIMVSTGAHAADGKTPPPVLKALQAQGLTDVQEFDAGSSVRGFAGIVGDEPMSVYVTPDGNAIVGTRVDAQGSRIDAKKMDELVIKPRAAKIMKQLSESKWVLDGKPSAPRVVYVFTDPNCPYCHAFWEAARPWVESGKVQIRYLVVGIIREDSPAKAAAILGAKDPAEALTRSEKAFSKGGIAAEKTISPEVQKQLDGNLALMMSLDIQGTPGIVQQGADGKLSKFGGMPRSGGLESILGPK